jgi:geranylgeranylglycerol-phosphate geranylgeranyltransferase
MMHKLKALWELMRLEHGLMLVVAIAIGSLIAQKTLPPLTRLILTFFTALFLEASTFALNDYYDLEIDRKNKRTDRPLVRGDLKPQTALYVFAVLFPLGILSSFFVNPTCFIIAGVTGLFAVLYDVKLKRIKLIGNFYIAYVMAIPFIFGGAATLEGTTFSLAIPPAVYTVALIAFLAGSGREIMKDVMDFEGDRKTGVRSFPRYIGIRGSNVLAAVFYLCAIALSFIPFFIRSFEFYFHNYYYLFLVLITDVLLLVTSVQLLVQRQVDLRFHRRFTLVALFVGLLAFLIGAFIHY